MTHEDEAILIELPEEDDVRADSGAYDLRASRDDLGERLDRFVSARLPHLSRSYVQQLIERGNITVDDEVRKQKFKITPGELIRVVVPEAVSAGLEPEDIPLDVVFEDDDVLVINKPSGLVVHPAPGHATGTLVNAVMHHVPGIATGGAERPGLVHRLDRDTTGLMVIAKSDLAYQSLVKQWDDRAVLKEYAALVQGLVGPADATIDAPIARDRNHRQKMAVVRGGREAVSHFTVNERFDGATLLDVIIDTGRTHQIRVHLAFIGHPVVGDTVYGSAKGQFGAPRQMLHASRLGFTMPGGEYQEFVAPIPPDMTAVLDALRSPGAA